VQHLLATETEAMAVVDPNFEQHRQTWIGFTRLIKYALAVIILILIGLATFTL
jgi:hypothetical protein